MVHTEHIATDHPLSPNEQRALRIVAGLMIPASAEYAVPGADDATIFADILASARPLATVLKAVLAQLDDLANGRFLADAAAARIACERFSRQRSPQLGALESLVVACYYRDDRVMRSLGMEPRPPFPRGYEIEAGDWSLLDPVRARPKLYRDAP